MGLAGSDSTPVATYRFRMRRFGRQVVEKSIEWIGKNKDNPFFLFFASHDLHVPRIPHERFRHKSGLSYRGDVIVQLDWCVGEIVKYISKRHHDRILL